MRIETLLALSLLSGALTAGTPDPGLAISPAFPNEGQATELVVTTTSCTVLPPMATIVRSGVVVRVELEVPDFCSPPDVVPERRYPLGVFGRGQYLVEVYYCGNVPPPLPRCSLTGSLLMGVAGAQHPVPSLRSSGVFLLVMMIMGLALRHSPRT